MWGEGVDIKGRIHSFESFGTVDGPGIRFVVFMQGCPLRCLYCHNRDTWEIGVGEEYTPQEVIERMQKYMSYMEFSGGGITITGGEPTLQAEFVAEVFRLAKGLNVHTTLDTNGFVDIGVAKKLLSYTDLVLLDIKHIDEKKHRSITGVSNEKVKKFSEYVSQKEIPLWIRYVLIPGFTNDENDLKLTAEFIKQLGTVEKIEVLPYHNMGEYKWKELGEKYRLKDIKIPTEEEVEKATQILLGKDN